MSKSEKERLKAIQEKCVSILTQLLKEEDNKYCVDCDAKGPRWASWNLGVFLCIRCAGIHRNLGVHISKVKSVNLDTWTPEQVGSLQQMGNSKGRAVYEANLPDNFRRPSSDSGLEVFIRAKYETKKYIAKEWVPKPAKPAFNTDDMKKKTDKRRIKSTANIIPVSKTSAAAPLARPKGTEAPKEVAQKQEVTSSNDLLGLESSQSKQNDQEDMFGLFVGGPSVTSSVPQTNGTISEPSSVPSTNKDSSQPSQQEGGDFFKQAADPSSKKMTNESIMSLFGSGTTNSQQVFGMPGGVYVSGQVPNVPPQPTQSGMMMNSGYTSIPNGMAPNVGMMGHPGQIKPASQQPGVGGMGPNAFLANSASVPSQQSGFCSRIINSNQNVGDNTSQLFGTNVPQQQNTMFHTNDLIGWNASPNNNMPLPSARFHTPQLHQQMAAMQLSGNQPSTQAWRVNQPGTGQTMGVPQTNMWMPQQAPVGAMPVQGQTLANNLWK